MPQRPGCVKPSSRLPSPRVPQLLGSVPPAPTVTGQILLEPRGSAGARAAARGRGDGGKGRGAGTAAPGKLGRGCVHTHGRTHARLHTQRSCNAVALREAAGKLRPRPPRGLRQRSALARCGEVAGTRGQGCALPCQRLPPEARVSRPSPRPTSVAPLAIPGSLFAPPTSQRGRVVWEENFCFRLFKISICLPN